jgi:ABC-2 type transport system ATP-binding protein
VIIEAHELHKTYRRGGRAVAALAGMSLGVLEGGVHGLVGPNGAGKSTLLRILLGLVRANRGDCRVLGGPPGNAQAMRDVGSMIETPRLWPFLTGAQTLRVLARTSGLSLPDPEAALARVGLEDAAHRRTATYSVGMKQRLGVATALLGAPRLLILDEPLNGLDPAGIREMRGLIAGLAAEGVTVLLSSHVLSEVERVCDRVTIIKAGRAVAEGRVSDFLSPSRLLRIDAAPLDAALRVAGPKAEIRDGALWATVAREAAPRLIAALAGAGVQVFEARWTGADLESLFFAATDDESGGVR